MSDVPSNEKPHRYEYNVDVSSDSAPARVVRMVGFDKRVLEIGAGPGSITRVLRDSRTCRVTAVEADETVIPMLSPWCERVYRVDLNDAAWAQTLKGEDKFDVVVAADVLEHLYDPWSVLKEMRGLISDDGCVVLSIPHAGHNALLACLMDENFDYRARGLLDRTHIRFFGIKNIQALFEDAGLAIVDAEFVVQFPEDTEFADAWNKLPAATRLALSKNPFGTVYQVVVRAVPAERANRRVVLSELSIAGSDAGSNAGSKTTVPVVKSSAKVNGSPEDIRLIAFFLTQFHPTEENDRWWGKGFTEWTNVTKADPLFEGHYQPHLPSDLGFYDLRLREARHAQIALARQYGIDAFCYYYYWFSGTRILNRPLDDMLEDTESDMPFCLCWANENWTRRWDGAAHEILVSQKYLPGDDLDFIKSVIPFFNDPRYIRFNGKPILLVYQPQHLPDPTKTAATWREYCREIGIGEIHLCSALTHRNTNYAKFGFDNGVEFPPNNFQGENLNKQIDFYTPFHGWVVDYPSFAQSYLDAEYEHPDVFRGVCPSWDQTARVGPRSFMLANGTPANYEYWLRESIRKTRQDYPGEERLVFINAWNEWAEGCHLEPDRRYQRGFLEATFRARTNISEAKAFVDSGVPTVVEPLSGIATRLHELQDELSAERQRLALLEQNLATERQRTSEVYADLSDKRLRLAALEQQCESLREQLRTAGRTQS